MKIFSIFLTIIVIVTASSDLEKWNNFKTKFGKSYSSSVEETRRFSIFKNNLLKIEEHNKQFYNGERKHKMGVTRFADLSEEEMYGNPNKQPSFVDDNNTVELGTTPLKGYCWYDYFVPKKIMSLDKSIGDNPESIDYRDKGFILPPRDMGDSEIHWAYSIAANIEATLAAWNGTKEYLSVQYIIDCTESYSRALYKVFTNGLPRDEDYPVINGKGECRELCSGACTKYSILAHESNIEGVVGNLAPVTIFFDGSDLPLYESGIIDGKSCYNTSTWWDPDPNAFKKQWSAVVVGYGIENDTDYWILKNSWGTSWGEDGYFRLVRGQLACGIEAFAAAINIEAPQGECGK